MNKEYILIFTHPDDESVKECTMWLHYWGERFIRINAGEDTITLDRADIDKDVFQFKIILNDTLVIDSSSIKSVWFRGGRVELKGFISKATSRRGIKQLSQALDYFLSAHSYSILEMLALSFESNQKILGKNAHGRINKMIVLKHARLAGLSIPETIVATHKSDVALFLRSNGRIIIKSLDVNFEFFDLDRNQRLYGYTNEVHEDHLCKLPDQFAPTIFQRLIEKKYEIRSFYLNGDIYSAAIFSQNNSKTTVDYRRYDYEKMNRVIPVTLPEEILNRIRLLMKSLDLSTGSIDFIKGTDDAYYFLEINPIGQFGYISNVCNFQLEKHISKFLS